jgi:hypothetical protein
MYNLIFLCSWKNCFRKSSARKYNNMYVYIPWISHSYVSVFSRCSFFSLFSMIRVERKVGGRPFFFLFYFSNPQVFNFCISEILFSNHCIKEYKLINYNPLSKNCLYRAIVNWINYLLFIQPFLILIPQYQSDMDIIDIYYSIY